MHTFACLLRLNTTPLGIEFVYIEYSIGFSRHSNNILSFCSVVYNILLPSVEFYKILKKVYKFYTNIYKTEVDYLFL